MSHQLERQERLALFFRSNPAIWDDITEEIKLFISNGEQQMKAKNCEQRDWHAGYCIGLEELLKLKGQYQRWENPLKPNG